MPWIFLNYAGYSLYAQAANDYHMNASFKKITLLCALITCAAEVSCTRHHGIIHRIEPYSRYDTEVLEDGRGLIRSVYCDIYAESVNPDQWEKLLKNRIFINKKSNARQYRIPRLFFFHVTVTNTSEKPLLIENVQLKYGSNSMDTMSPGEIQARMKSPVYSILNFDSILETRKLVTGPAPLENIRYGLDTVTLRLPFIPPSDSIDRILAFCMAPVQARKISLVFTLKTAAGKKIIDFDFVRKEYRTRGSHYRNPDKK